MTRSSPKATGDAILQLLKNLFKMDKVTGLASVELWVLLTTVLLVLRFLFDFSGPWFGNPRRMFFVLTLETLNQNLVIYTMGLMQLSGVRVNDYFQVWAVLLVTLQYSVKIGRPYTRSKQVPLLDLMSSFWSANLLRVQTLYLLRIPLWLIWSLNAVRIIVLFVSSGKGEKNHQESMRLVSDYMSYEHTLSNPPDDQQEFSMSGYKYVVHGEHLVLKEIQEDPLRSDHSYKIMLDPDVAHKEKIVTVEKICHDTSESRLLGGTEGPGNRHKELCLSFALYKLLRRRFYGLPLHELQKTRLQGKTKIIRLTTSYILKESEKAFQISGVELSFVRDLFYSKHATMFAGGLLAPLWSLLLSLSLATAVGYIGYPVRYIPERMDPADRNRITHGVFITRLMVGIIVLKELSEIFIYWFSRWAKVLLLCNYVQHQCWRHPMMEMVMRFILFPSEFMHFLSEIWSMHWLGRKANQMDVRQQNLLVTARVLRRGFLPPLTMSWVSIRGVIYGTTSLTDYTKTEIINKLKDEGINKLKDEGILLDKYFSNAFKSDKEEDRPVKWPCDPKAADTHIILVWHIATCLCEIHFFDKVKKLKARRRPEPFVTVPNGNHQKKETEGPAAEQEVWSEEYFTAVSLSNYCVYLVMKELVPDNGLVARNVLDEVIEEIDFVTSKFGVGSMTLEDVYKSLKETVGMPCKNHGHHTTRGADVEAVRPDQGNQVQEEDKEYADLDIGCSLTRMGAMLAENLEKVYQDKAAQLWSDLANFWVGFLLYLAANTSPGTHAKHLAGETELITHLWALLTHAGYGGKDTDGKQGLDPEAIPDIDQEAAKG
ncbi:unnamed protein product [Urochloa humidicola]